MKRKIGFSDTRSLFRLASCLILAVGAAVTILIIVLRSPACERLSCLTVQGSVLWKEKEVYEYTPQSYRALFTNDDDLIRVEKTTNISAKDAELLTSVGVMKVTGLFDDARSPYPGAISDRIHCDTKFNPIVRHLKNATTEVTYYTTRLNNRLQAGSCIDSEIVFKSYAAYFYCPKEKALYHLELIAKQDADDKIYTDIIQSIRCHKPNLWNTSDALR